MVAQLFKLSSKDKPFNLLKLQMLCCRDQKSLDKVLVDQIDWLYQCGITNIKHVKLGDMKEIKDIIIKHFLFNR